MSETSQEIIDKYSISEEQVEEIFQKIIENLTLLNGGRDTDFKHILH